SSLIFNAYMKIPLQLVILLMVVLVFLFYQFEKAPLVFHRGEQARLASGPAASEYQQLQLRYDHAYEHRRAAALALAGGQSASGNQALTARYQAAQSEL